MTLQEYSVCIERVLLLNDAISCYDCITSVADKLNISMEHG